MTFNPNKVINGTYGELWVDDIMTPNVKAVQAKFDKNKETLNFVGELAEGYKMTSISGKGSITLYKVDDDIQRKEIEAVMKGIDLQHTIITGTKDPNATSSKVALKGVSFDDITVTDWEVAKLGEVTIPFTFRKAEYL